MVIFVNDMARQYFRSYIWLLETLRSRGRLTLAEIKDLWMRSAVNDELTEVAEMMETAPGLLNEGGRLCVISFHSLEDRIVKNAIASREKGCTCPREFPVCVCGFKQTLRSVTRKRLKRGRST